MAFGIWLIVSRRARSPQSHRAKKPNLKELLGKIRRIKATLGVIRPSGAPMAIRRRVEFWASFGGTDLGVTMTATVFRDVQPRHSSRHQYAQALHQAPTGSEKPKMDATVAKLAPLPRHAGWLVLTRRLVRGRIFFQLLLRP